VSKTPSFPLEIHRFEDLVDYTQSWNEMREFTRQRTDNTPDQLWALQHPPVYTQGQAGKPEHLLTPSSIPVVPTDRGGQITYHGPGQVVIYLLIDLKRRRLGVRDLVRLIEQAVIDFLEDRGIEAERRAGAPGVYVKGDKIAALGLRVRNGATYHGLSLNVKMDLSPFLAINPCGYQGLKVIQLCDLCPEETPESAREGLLEHLTKLLSS
jgi:lipoyl(octanoyl) transferase